MDIGNNRQWNLLCRCRFIVDDGAGGTNRKMVHLELKLMLQMWLLQQYTNKYYFSNLSLTVDNIVIGTNIGHTSDTDVPTIDSSGNKVKFNSQGDLL